MSLLWLLVIILLVAAIAGAPNFGLHQHGWAPSGIGTVIVLLLVLWLLGVFR